MLFEDKIRLYDGPKTYVENDFEYLDRSARKEAENVRCFLNKWVGLFPEPEAKDLISRIKSRERRSFDSAIFEIVLYAIISGLGGKIEVHPVLENGSTKRPDFLVRMPKGEEFYLEAVLASEFGEAEMAAEKRKNVVLSAIEKIDSPNFFVGITAEGDPDKPPSGKALSKLVATWLAGLDPDVVDEEITERRQSVLNVDCDGWHVKFEAIPKKAECRGNGQRVVGFITDGARWVNCWQPIRDAVKAKGGKYGELHKPYIVAVNFDCVASSRIDEMQALFGQEQFLLSASNPDAKPIMQRLPNGVWFGIGGPQYTRVSGVWIFGGLDSWNIVSRRNFLYFNPWCQYPLPDDMRKVNHAVSMDGNMKWIKELQLFELLGLPAEWPEC